MKRWASAFAVVAALCVFVFAGRSTRADLLKDTDTAALLYAIQDRDALIGWFGGDSPLGNHFFRPLSTLSFKTDLALYGTAPDGYATTNALIAVGCILALFWLLRELTDRPAFACVAASLFAIWHLPSPFLPTAIDLAAVVCFLIPAGMLLPGRRLMPNLVAFLVSLVALEELAGGRFDLHKAALGQLPGRMATAMALFALAAAAAYARYERKGAGRAPAPPTATDVPATKSAGAVEPVGRWNTLWAVLACLFAALAFGCYEQAVMLPAVLLGVAVYFRMQGRRVRWAWQAAFWGVLAAYLALRYALVGIDLSAYQRHQIRTGSGAWMSLADLILPAVLSARELWMSSAFGLGVLWTTQTFQAVGVILCDAATAFSAKRRLPLFLFGWGLSVVAFLPMAWLKPFSHYTYWPATFRAVLATTLVLIAAELTVNAWSRPARQAPPRLDPAPGSLPRP